MFVYVKNGNLFETALFPFRWRLLSLQVAHECATKSLLAPTCFAVQKDVDFRVHWVHQNAP